MDETKEEIDVRSWPKLFDKMKNDLNTFNTEIEKSDNLGLKGCLIDIISQSVQFGQKQQFKCPQVIITCNIPNINYPQKLEIIYHYDFNLMVNDDINNDKQDIIKLRPRLISILYHINVLRSGLFNPIIFDPKIMKHNNLQFDSLFFVFKSIVYILLRPVMIASNYNNIQKRQNDINFVMKTYKPLYKNLFPSNNEWNWHKILDRKFIETFKNTNNIQKYIKNEVDDKVYSFKLLNDEFCDMLYAELRNYECDKNMIKFRPNTMNNYGVILNYIGLQPLINQLCNKYLYKFAKYIYNDNRYNFTYYDSLDHHHTFSVEYKIDYDIYLDMHIDDSEVTFNVNIFDKYKGANIEICGLSGEYNKRHHLLSYKHEKGRCLVHSGKQRHGAKSITSGERCNLIIWCKSSWLRSSQSHCHYEKVVEDDEPDSICLSMKYDKDYIKWMNKYAVKQGGLKNVATLQKFT